LNSISCDFQAETIVTVLTLLVRLVCNNNQLTGQGLNLNLPEDYKETSLSEGVDT